MTGTLRGLLRHSAATHPDRRAVEDPERDGAINYRALDRAADFITDALVRNGVSAGDRVGLYAPKSIAAVSAIFGILALRAAYVPVDPGSPPRRNAKIFEDCAVNAVVLEKSLVEVFQAAWHGPPMGTVEELGDSLVLVANMARDGESVSRPATSDPIDDVAYILYTSGSTGQPKGIVHTDRSALSFIDWCSQQFEPTEHDRFSSHAPFHFDLSILDIYLPIKHGATLVLIGDDASRQPRALAPLIADRRITIWYSTPSILRLLEEYGRLHELDCSALRLVLFAGEVFPVKHLRALKKIWPAPKYYNLYGPTETNVCTCYNIPPEIPDDRADPFPIGFVCSGDRAIVADEKGHEVEPGNEGELLVTGGSVMQEYWALPEKTAEVFVVDSATRWYRTGDIVRQSPRDGYIFVGRRDRMVKRRGYRVELGEIEAALYRHSRVNEAAVTSLPDEENGVSVRAYLAISPGSRPSLVEMKRFCTEQLPAYMIPDRFVFLETLPKTSTDKIDYNRLKELS